MTCPQTPRETQRWVPKWNNERIIKLGTLLNLQHFEGRRACLSQPHFGLSVRMRLTLPKVGKWSPPGLLKTQSSISRVKSLCIWMFLISLKRSWSGMSKMTLYEPFRHMQPKLWAKEGPGVKLAVWLPTTKSRESTSSWHLMTECDMALESSQGELQLWSRPCFNRTLQLWDMSSQSPKTPT